MKWVEETKNREKGKEQIIKEIQENSQDNTKSVSRMKRLLNTKNRERLTSRYMIVKLEHQR